MNRISEISNQIVQNNSIETITPNRKVTVEYIDNNRVGVIYLNSPKDLNVLSLQLESELFESLVELTQSQEVSKAFCAGADINRFTKNTQETLLIQNPFANYDNTLFSVNKPLICGVNGYCLGGGLELALACDIIFTSDEAKFGFPEIKLGLFPGLGGTQRFAKIAGKVRANQYILSGHTFDAQKALQMNVAAEVFTKEKLHEEVLKYAKDIAQYSMYTLIQAKRSVNKSEDLGITEGLNQERSIFSSLFNLPGSKEGISAFINKRKPNFDKI